MTTYHQEKINTTIAKIAECMARDPKRAERLLGDVKKWSAEAEREAYARGKADAAPQASAEARNAALEEAARVAEQWATAYGSRGPAAVIRALKSAPAAKKSAIDKPIPDSVEHYGLIDERVGAPAAEASAKGAGDAKDAERYRWLRVQPFEVWKRIAWNTWGDDPAVATHRDAAIDAAIAQQRQEGQP